MDKTLDFALYDIARGDDGILTARYERDPAFMDRISATEYSGRNGCAHCGRPVGKRDLWVFDMSGDCIVHPDDVAKAMDSDPSASWIGWLRIGPVCAKAYKGWTLTHAAWLKREEKA